MPSYSRIVSLVCRDTHTQANADTASFRVLFSPFSLELASRAYIYI
jgi:hypothetical protein